MFDSFLTVTIAILTLAVVLMWLSQLPGFRNPVMLWTIIGLTYIQCVLTAFAYGWKASIILQIMSAIYAILTPTVMAMLLLRFRKQMDNS